MNPEWFGGAARSFSLAFWYVWNDLGDIWSAGIPKHEKHQKSKIWSNKKVMKMTVQDEMTVQGDSLWLSMGFYI